jgi:hypothetical protein
LDSSNHFEEETQNLENSNTQFSNSTLQDSNKYLKLFAEPNLA